jgi:serine acetyltransferase
MEPDPLSREVSNKMFLLKIASATQNHQISHFNLRTIIELLYFKFFDLISFIREPGYVYLSFGCNAK